MSSENIEQIYKFTFVIGEDVAMVVMIPPHEDQLKNINCLRSNPDIAEVGPDDNGLITFNFMNDGVINYSLEFYDSEPYQRHIACLRSNPTIVEAEMSNPIKSGWKYNGTTFTPPS